MEEQTTWKGHTFTLFVFTGIVVLCSIFFILGTLVGRAQGLKIASNPALVASAKNDSKPAPNEDKPDFTFYDSVKKEQPADVPAALDPPAKADPKPDPPEVRSKLDNLVNYQIGAVRKQSDAEKLLSQLKKKGFRAFILAPSVGDRNPFFRVQVGPFVDPGEAQTMKKKLENAGYQPILKK